MRIFYFQKKKLLSTNPVYFLLFLFFLFRSIAFSQSAGIFGSANLGVNTSGAIGNLSSIFDISSSSGGVLIPRVTFAQRTGASFNPLPEIAQGLIVYQTDAGGNGEGFYYNTSITTTPAWVLIAAGGGTLSGGTTNYIPKWTSATVLSSTSLLYDNGTNVGIGTTSTSAKLHIKGSADNSQLIVMANATQSNTNPLIKLQSSAGSDLLWIHSDNVNNIFIGLNAGRVNNAGGGATGNIFIGPQAGFANTTGSENIANGFQALYSNTTGNWNTATGTYALNANTTGSSNIAIGYNALRSNVAGSNATVIGRNAMYYAYNTATAFTNYNVAVGYEALRGSTTAANNSGNYNTSVGYQTLYNNTSGGYNTANGVYALFNNTAASQNTAIGYQSLYTQNFASAFSSNNVAVGYQALYSNNPTATTNGYQNTAIGNFALNANTTGSSNVGLGMRAGYTATPANANTTGSNNTFIGYNSGPGSATQRTNATAIGYNALVDASNALVLGGTGADAVNVGIGTTAPASMFSVGAGNQFQVNSTGDIVKLNNVTTSFPPANAAGFLQNNGSGTLSWVAGNAGTVTSFSAGTLSPLFTTTVATATTTPALSFTLSTAAAYSILGNNTGGAAAPTYFVPTLASALFQNQGTSTTVLHGNVAGNPSWGPIVSADITDGTIADADIASGTITYSKIQNVTASRLLGNPTGAAAASSEIPLGTGLSFSAGNLIISGGVLSGGTANYIPKWTSATALSSTSLLYDDGNNVGIGTSTPTHMLHIHKNGAFNPYAHFTDASTGTTSTDGLIIGTNGAGTAYLISQETAYNLNIGNVTDNNIITIKGGTTNVGIGSTSPSAKLDVSTSGTTAISGYTTGSGNAGYFQINNAANSATSLYTTTNGTGYAFLSTNSGTSGNAGMFQITNTSNASHGLVSTTGGNGDAGSFQINQPAATGNAVYGSTIGTGKAAKFENTNASAAAGARYGVYSTATGGNPGTNVAGYFSANNATTANYALQLGGSTSGTLSISPAAVTTDYSIAMPMAQGAASTFLQNDGAGNLSWASASSTAWGLTGNASTVDGTNFIGTTDNIPFNIRVNNFKAGRISSGDNLFLGYLAGNSSNIAVIDNIAIGDSALYTQSFATAFSSENVAIGNSALFTNNPTLTTNGMWNTAIGNRALRNNTTGKNNTASGFQALYSNTSGGWNTASGVNALFTNSTGNQNTALGNYALYLNTSGTSNTATGNNALYSNTTGGSNTASGDNAMYGNTLGSSNTVSGYYAMYNNTTAGQNVAIGRDALYAQSFNNGAAAWNSDNVALGYQAMYSNQPIAATFSGTRNTGVGSGALRSNTTGYDNAAFGTSSLYFSTTAQNNSAFGAFSLYNNVAGSNNTAVGNSAMSGNTYATQNVAVGRGALYTQNFINASTPWATDNTAIGNEALYFNNPTSSSNGYLNTAIGSLALRANTTGAANVATGSGALYQNTIGGANIATGTSAMYTNSTGSSNVAIGHWALYLNLSGSYNNAVGREALFNNTATSNNAFGYRALYNNTASSDNIAIGDSALYTQSFATAFSSQNVAIGNSALFLNNPTATTNGYLNTAIGNRALRNNTTGSTNTATGYSSLYSNTTGNYNTASGYQALYSNTTGGANTASGYQALYSNTTGTYNTASGIQALYFNTIGTNNTANGYVALYFNTTASRNTAIGQEALYTQSFSNGGVAWNTENTAIGYRALYANQPTSSTNGYLNTAIGVFALNNNTTGSYNTATGNYALWTNATGNQNAANGYAALNSNTASYNTANGNYALWANNTGGYNTASGYSAGDTYADGSYNTFLGYSTDVSAATLSNCIAIGGNGNLGIAASNTVRIGNASMSGIGGQVGWTTVSDARTKKDVRENVPGLAFIKELRPVTYHYDKNKEDALMNFTDSSDYPEKYAIEKILFSGFLAQEVEAAAKKLNYEFSGIDKTQLTKDGKGYYGLRYAEFTVPLVKAVQELDKKNEELRIKNEELETEISKLNLKMSEFENMKIENAALKTNIKQLSTSNEQLTKDVEKIKEYLELKSKK